MTAESVAAVLMYRHFPMWGVPREFYTDLGSEFTAKVTENLMKSTGTIQKFTLRSSTRVLG